MATVNLLAKLYAFPKTILTTKDIALLWGETNTVNLLTKIKYYAKQGSLIRLSRGIYAKSRDYELKELATSIYTPSYISFETVLREAGVIFQHHDATYVAGPYPTTKKIDGHTIVFRTLKDSILYNSMGVTHTPTYSIATTERAFLDMLYLCPKLYFDNLGPLDWDRCLELSKIYDNAQLVKRMLTHKRYAQ